MSHKTPFGLLKPPPRVGKKRIEAVQRALRWCETILTGTLWTSKSVGHKISLQRTINEQTIEIFPLEAAFLDLGMKSRFPAGHLPIHLNNSNACVRSTHYHPRPLHTDMIASMILLLGRAKFDPAEVPRTLRSILTEKQIASLPPRQYRERDMPAPVLDSHPLTMADEEAREYILTTPEHNWRHHADRLSATLQPNTLRWVLFHLIETHTFPSAFTWALEKMYVESALFPYADIVETLSHPNRLVRSWAVMNLHSDDEKALLDVLKPIRYDENPLVTHKVLTRIRGFALSDEEKIELISPLLDLDRYRNVAIIHLGHLSLEPARKFEILSPFLTSTNSDEVISAIRGLRYSGSEQTEQALVQCFDHENNSVLRCLLQSVASFGPWFEPYAQHLITIPELYSDILKAMKRSYGFNQVPIIEAIINGERNCIVVRGLALLSEINSSESIEIVGSFLATHELRYIRRHAAEYIGEAGHLAGLPFLRQASNDISNGVRTSAKRSLEGILKARSVVL
jgi:hypothetical protein